jgi:TP901 family phage tail tape measure protein
MANELISVVVQLKDKFSGKLKGINKSVSGFSKGILSSRLSLAALSATIGLAINDFAKFEKKMVDVGNLFGATQSEVQALSKEVLDISKRIPQSAQVLSDALFDVVSAGIAVKDSTKFLETAAKLATAGVTDTKIAVDGLTTV